MIYLISVAVLFVLRYRSHSSVPFFALPTHLSNPTQSPALTPHVNILLLHVAAAALITSFLREIQTKHSPMLIQIYYFVQREMIITIFPMEFTKK